MSYELPQGHAKVYLLKIPAPKNWVWTTLVFGIFSIPVIPVDCTAYNQEEWAIKFGSLLIVSPGFTPPWKMPNMNRARRCTTR